MTPSDRHHRLVLELVGQASTALSLDEYRRCVLDGLGAVIPSEFLSYNELADGAPTVALTEPVLPAWAHEAWNRHGHTNPLIVNAMRLRDLRPYRFSDVIAEHDLRAMSLYRELYEPLGIRHQIAFQLPTPPRLLIGIALSRTTSDFSDAEREVLDLARPHLIRSYRAAQLRDELRELVAVARRGAEAAQIGIVVAESGVVRFTGGPAARLVAGSGLGELVEGDPLPPALAGPEWPRILQPRGDAVLVRRIEDGDETVLVFEPARSVLSGDALSGLGLSPRESEVLACFARGAETEQAAATLGISVATVHKHAQAIHAKLGVNTRAQAVATAWAAAGAVAATTH